jgi:type III restriction enzyme
MKEYSQCFDSWVKSVDRAFYDIPYSFRAGSKSSLARGGGHQKWAKFNPDFFIKIGKDILVVEIKSDEDVTEVNKAKLKYAEEHYKELNKAQNKFKYYFKFLSPQDFAQFFEALCKKKYTQYTSNLMAELKS